MADVVFKVNELVEEVNGYVFNDPLNNFDPFGLSQAQIDQAMNWLNQNHSEVTRGLNNWSVGDGWLPFDGGMVLPGDNIRINTSNMDDMDVVGVLAHELMHARDGFWPTIFGDGQNHDRIYDDSAKIANEYGRCK